MTMTGENRRKLGRSGSHRRMASATAIAILAVSPVIVPMAGSHLDGIALAVTESVFGQPVSAQDHPCPAIVPCVAAAEEDYQQCLDDNPWYLDGACWFARSAELLACAIKLVTG